MSNETPRRFAALVRVSTEKQEKQGESLRTQRTQLANSIQHIGGTIAGWYGGQEHATVGWEKKEVDRLLSDAQRRVRLFDAVIVTDPTRWSRDNVASETGLEVLRDKNIRFYVQTQEYDLFNEEARLYLSMSTVVGGYHARKQKRKSLENRIERAKRGFPVCGKLPFGRTYSKSMGTWAVDEEKRALIEDIARRYLAGERLPDLAEEYRLNHSNLHRVLTHRCGTRWEQTFNSDDLNIHENITIDIPRLLPDATIKAIRQQAEANRTYQHGQLKNQYLLSHMTFCDHCGYAMFGQTNHGARRYYRHAHVKRKKVCNGAKAKMWISAEQLEENVITRLFECFGNPEAVKKAIEEATPNHEKIVELRRRQEAIEKALGKIKSGRDRLLRLVVDEAITETHAAEQLKDLLRRETRLLEESERLADNLQHAPTPGNIEAVAHQIAKKFRQRASAKRRAIVHDANSNLAEMTWEEKRSLVEMVFSGKTPGGQRMGVYIEWLDDGKRWKYTICGHLISVEGCLPMSKRHLATLFTFGAPEQQEALVTKCAWRCRARGPP